MKCCVNSKSNELVNPERIAAVAGVVDKIIKTRHTKKEQ